ncbi:unnamed protein product [Oikopleura dioica]|uniref:Vacuolar protein sorting-associated protein 54 C-terminal domain-containing protein n=1 Tax=Oikopleura dioica TaxID=34765 RepID=E4X2J6_OIKDI|nr:unnamed protein product [Oikopleura dioica]
MTPVDERRRRSSASSVKSSVSYSDTERRWGVLDARVCLPAVLNDPRKSSRYANEPVPVIPPSNLPEVKLSDFAGYLKKLKHRNHDQKTLQIENQAQKGLTGSSITSKIPTRFYQNDFDTRKEIQFALSAGKITKTENICVHDAQLKHWLDLTEVELSRRLSSRAASFLAAVSAQDTLKDLLENAQKTAKNLRSEVKIIGETVSGSFAAVHRNNKIARLKETTRLLKVIQTVQQSPATIRLLISTYDFSAAKEYIETIREVLQNELQGISGLKNLHAELDNAEKQLNGILVEEASSIFEILLIQEDIDADRTKSIQEAIVCAGRLADTTQAIHDIVEKRADDLLSRFKDLEGVAKIEKDIASLTKLLHLVKRGVFIEEFEILCKSSVEVVQHRLLRVLQEKHFTQEKDFLQILPILYEFTNTCLREFNTQGPLVMQLKAETNRYLNKFHDERRQRLALLLDSEEWRPAEVPKELQEAIDDVLAQGQGVLKTGVIPVRPKRPAISSAAEISGDKFVVIGCSLLMIKMIKEYLGCLNQLPSSTLLHKLADLLFLFNSRCCQLVLGGGATATLGLRSITTKHLAITARSLQLVLRVIPSVRGAASSVLSDDNTTQVALRQLNKVESDFQTHIQELWGKISAIMDDFFAKHVQKYEVKAPVPSATMKTVVKQVKKLSDSLQEVLQPAEHVTLISKIHTSFNQKMDRRIKALKTSKNDGLLLSDISFYMSSVRKIDGMTGIDWS